VRWFAGNLLQSRLERGPGLTVSSGARTELAVDSDDVALRFIQLLPADAPPLNMAVPSTPQHRSTIRICRLSDGRLTLELHPENVIADVLLRYMGKGLVDQAVEVMDSSAPNAERLLVEKVEDPVAASVVAYVLLRLGELDRLQDRTENLMTQVGWLPDGLTIRAEHLARLGEHDRAFALLIQLSTRGLPMFSDGLSYAVGRLRLYLRQGPKHFPGKTTELKHAKATLRRLQAYATFVDFRNPVLTFTGSNLLKPDDKRVVSRREPAHTEAAAIRAIRPETSPIGGEMDSIGELTCSELLAQMSSQSTDLSKPLPSELLSTLKRNPKALARQAIANWVLKVSPGILTRLMGVATGSPPGLSTDDAEKVVQEAILDLINHVVQGSPMSEDPTAMLISFAENRVISFSDKLRKGSESPPTPEEKREALLLRIRQLEPEYQDIIRLRYFRQLTVNQVAAFLGIAEDKANERLERARLKLRGLPEPDPPVVKPKANLKRKEGAA